MSNTFLIESKLLDVGNNPLLVDIEQGGAPAPKVGAFLDVFTPTGNKNQLWTAKPDPKNPGYFLIQSQQPSNDNKTLFIDIHGVTQAKAKKTTDWDTTKLDAFTQDSNWHENQLWTIAINPETQPNLSAPRIPQRDFIFIQSYLKNSAGDPFVIDIQGWKPGSKLTKGKSVLNAFHQKRTNTDNQLWVLRPQNWHFAPKITGFFPFYNVNNPGASTLGVSGTGFYPGSTLALVLTSLVAPPTQGRPILAVTDFAGNFDMGTTLLDPGWGYPGLSTEGEFSIAVFDNKTGILEGPSIASATAQWNGIGIAGFSNS